ncbi:spermidine/putrescine ABC transporter permease PotB [Deferrisoma sp.]
MGTTRSLFRTWAIALAWGWLGAFVFLPTLLVVGLGFLERDEAALVRFSGSLAAYARLLDPLYLGVLLRSAGLALEATLWCLALAYPFAYLVARMPPRTRRLALVLVVVPYWTNSLVRAYAIRSALATQGPVNALLLGLGLVEEPLRLLYTGGAVTLGLVYILLPFMILPLYAVFEKLDPALLEAAADLGAGRWQTLGRVVLPLSVPGVVAGALLVFLPALGMFYVADLLGGARDLLVGNLIKNQFLDARDWPFGAAISVGILAVMGVLVGAYAASVRRFRREVL